MSRRHWLGARLNAVVRARRGRRMMAYAAVLSAVWMPALAAQERGAAQLHLLMRGLTVTPRVLILGTQPEDADADLIAWLARGRMVETGYLSLTRGEGGENFAGRETGVTLGAIRTAEALAARRIDGGRQYFTRAYDIGFARNAEAVFKQWNRDTLLGQLVTVIRAVRPHVLINSFGTGVKDGDGQHEVLTILAGEAYVAAADSVTYSIERFGEPWTPLKLYERGAGVVVNAGEFDPVLGRTYGTIGFESRAQQRSRGLSDSLLRRSSPTQLRRVLSRVNEATPASAEKSLFDGIDTTFARLEAGFPRDVNGTLRHIAVYADSARAALDFEHPGGVVRYLSRAADLAASVRINAPWCRHAGLDARLTAGRVPRCSVQSLDLDASIDLVLRRINEALLIASGVTIESAADREIIGGGDSASVTVTVRNHGMAPVSLREVTVTTSFTPRGEPPVIIFPDSVARVIRVVSGLVDPHPWWIGQRAGNFYTAVENGLNGLGERVRLTGPWSTGGMTQPEDIHRTSDVTVLLDIGGAFVSMSQGPVMFPLVTPLLGAREHPLSEVPPVTLSFERSLEWMIAGKSVTREFRVMLTSYSDSVQRFSPKAFLPLGLRVDALPASITLAPREQRILFVTTHGMLEPARHEFGFFGISPAMRKFTEGFRTVQYSYLPPIRPFRSSAMYLRAVKIEVPKLLSVAYVQGVGDDVASALKQIGIPTVVIDPDDLLRLDLSTFSTLVIGPRAFETRPELLGKTTMLHEFARKGGTVVIMYQSAGAIESTILPFPVTLATPLPERVTQHDAPVTTLDRKSRLLNWPNVIGADDWSDWVGERALLVPRTVDGHYARPVEMHDPGEQENRNTILAAPLGKGMYIYTTLSLPQQIAWGVSGSLRLLVNMMSASLSIAR